MRELNRARDSQTKRSRGHRALLPYLILLIGLCFTIVVYYYFSKLTFEQDQSRFQSTVQELQDRTKLKLEMSVALLRATTGLFAASDEVDRGEFERFVQQFDLQKNYPGTQGIGFARRFAPQDKDALVQRMRAQGMADFRVWPEGVRDEYTAIVYLQPEANRNKVAIGYDMYADPVRREAMQRARDSGAPAASGRVRLVQEPKDEAQQWGFLIYIPVYQNGAAIDSVEQRRQALVGFVYSPFRILDFLAPITSAKTYDVDLEVFDGPETKDEYFFYGDRADPLPVDTHFIFKDTIPVWGRTWTMSYAIKPSFERGSGRPLLKFTIVTGVLLSFLFFFVTRSEVRARARAEQSALGNQ